MQKIKFIPDTKDAEILWLPPQSAKKYIPDWYKKTPKFISPDHKHFGFEKASTSATNTTIKSCMPFLDALSFGYIYELPADLELTKNFEGNVQIRWRFGDQVVTMHSQEQHPFLPKIEVTGKNEVFKFGFNFIIETPKNYSCLFTHPLNRHELPFRCFSGVVDTDSYQLAVQFPFQLIKDFDDFLLIEKGTPVIQIIPFKRESWRSTKDLYSEIDILKRKHSFFTKIQQVYKNQSWHKKTFI